MVENILIAIGGFGAGACAFGFAYRWRQVILAAREDLVEQQLLQADEMLATAEQLTVRYNALTEPTAHFAVVRPPLRTRWSQFRDRFAPVAATPDWAVGEILALATIDVGPPQPAAAPPVVLLPAPRRQVWDRHINRSGWPNKTVGAGRKVLVARLADLPNPATLAAHLSKLPDPTRVCRVSRSM